MKATHNIITLSCLNSFKGHIIEIGPCMQATDVQSNQKMHDLYATMHIFQIVLPDAFCAVNSQIFS